MSPRASRKNPFWKSLDQKLASVSMELAVEKDDFYSQEEWTVYRMHYTGLRGYRLFSWLSVFMT